VKTIQMGARPAMLLEDTVMKQRLGIYFGEFFGTFLPVFFALFWHL